MTAEKDHLQLAPGLRISVRGEDFLITGIVDNYNKSKLLHVDGISEVVKGRRYIFDTAIDKDIKIVSPENTLLKADNSGEYLTTKLFLETHVRNASLNSNKIEIGHKAAINPADYQLTPTTKSLELPRPRILIADAVGLGKTIEVGIFLAELIKRGKGKRILVLALKSILGQFQQELWSRFAIPLVRLDSLGILRIKSELPSNKNPFDYYDKTIISIDTLKNNAKFRHYIEKSRWDIIVIDECQTVANISSLRGDLGQYLATKCESLVLTSATPHNGNKESFANLITMIEPIAIPKGGEYEKKHVEPYYVRRFKKDLGAAVQDNFRDREVINDPFLISPEEEAFFKYQQNMKITALKKRKGSEKSGDLLFSIGLFKSFLSSPEACLETLNNRIRKIETEVETELEIESKEQLETAKRLVETVIVRKADSKFNKLLQCLEVINWRGRASDQRIIIFAERIKTLEKLYNQLKQKFSLADEVIVQFDGSLPDVKQEEIIEDFGKEDSRVRLFLTSDAGAQGVNLHFYCNVMFNYDIPWSIITLEQRNGRIDRYGQKKTPYIYYLVSQSDKPEIKADLRIIEKLSKKEDEIHRILGDAASFLKKYDTEKEENFVEEMIISGDDKLLDTSLENFDWDSIFGNESESTEVVINENPINTGTTFYFADFDYYKALTEYLIAVSSLQSRNVSVEDSLIEIINDKELDSYLYDLPQEAKPKRNSPYKLSTDKCLVQKSIDNARKKKGEWPEFQMLYDLHPIVRVFMNKLEANIDKDVALVVKTKKIAPDLRWYIFHGQIANNLGQAVLSDFFAIGLHHDGSFFKVLKIDEFIQENGLTATILNEIISTDEIVNLQSTIPEAIENAEHIYLKQEQDIWQLRLENKAKIYKEQLDRWNIESTNQLELEFEDKTSNIFAKASREKKVRQIKTILNEKSQYYKDITSLDNHPYIKLLAVFFSGVEQ